MPLSHDHIRTTVEMYLARHPHERAQLGALLDALDRTGDEITRRSTFTGHVTCGAVAVDDLGRVLHVLHLASGRFLAPGGHTETADESLAATAQRELHEETGIPPEAVAPWPGYETVPFDIDIHAIDARPGKGEPGHQHFDLRFLFRLHTTTDVPVVLQEEEVGGIAWRPVDRVTQPTLREKLLKLPLQVEPETANASALIYNDRGEYLLHLRDYFPGRIWEPGMWSLLGGGREPQDATLEHTVRRELAEEAGLDLADMTPFATEYATDSRGATVPIAIYAGRWNGDPRELVLTEGVMLAWFTPDDLHRLRITDTTSDLVRHHAASRPVRTATRGAHPAVPSPPTEDEPPEHHMHLLGRYYRQVEAGRKTIEVRVATPSRRDIGVGDTVVLHDRDTGRELDITVRRITAYSSLADLLSSEDAGRIDPDRPPGELLADLRDIYPPPKEALGVLALAFDHRPARPGRPMPMTAEEYAQTVPHHTVYSYLYIRDAHDRPIQLRSVYGARPWQFPGGNLDALGEDPLQTARREVVEETGLELGLDFPRLLLTHFMHAGPRLPLNKVGFIFEGGRLTSQQLDRIRLDPAEHDMWAVHDLATWQELMAPRSFARIDAVERARLGDGPAYLTTHSSPLNASLSGDNRGRR
jgi:8-oxo-dGTP pyrophosphatase MutT (NUDIX family)/ASC-1-like (ASCH) protein